MVAMALWTGDYIATFYTRAASLLQQSGYRAKMSYSGVGLAMIISDGIHGSCEAIINHTSYLSPLIHGPI